MTPLDLVPRAIGFGDVGLDFGEAGRRAIWGKLELGGGGRREIEKDRVSRLTN